MLPRLKFGPRYGRALCLSTLALGAGAVGCYSHAQFPGQVAVTDYGDGAVVEVELTELKLEAAELSYWFELAVQEEGRRCSPVRVRVRDDSQQIVPLESLDVGSVSGTAHFSGVDEWFVGPQDFRGAIYGDPVTVQFNGTTVRLHDEQVYNLRQFIEQVTCSDES